MLQQRRPIRLDIINTKTNWILEKQPQTGIEIQKLRRAALHLSSR